MPLGPEKKELKTYVKTELFNEVDRIAEILGISRSKMVGNLINAGMDDAKLLERLGILKIVNVAKSFKKIEPQKTL